MEPEPPANARKVRFAPKVPIRKAVKTAEPKTEVVEEVDAAQTRDLLRRINDGLGQGKPKAEKKSAPAQVAFGQGDTSNFMWSYRPSNSKTTAFTRHDATSDGERADKDYREPWNYYSYYPMTLPLRRPYSGDPVLLDEEEFGESSANVTTDEDSINSGVELGMMDENEDTKMVLLQLPTSLPLVKRSAIAQENEMADSSKSSRNTNRSQKGCSLEDMHPGCIGKLLVYRSGIIKLKLGDTLYDVSSGSDCIFAQDIMAVNTEEKHCCIVGEPSSRRAIVTPDIDSLLSTLADLD